MLHEHQASYFFYANNYSKDLLEDYIVQNNSSVPTLINIGEIPSITSDYCSSQDGIMGLIRNTISLHNRLVEKLTRGEYIYAVVPCTNHLMPGMFLALAKKYPENVFIDHVVEGTLNYCDRSHCFFDLSFPALYRLTLARIFKKLISFVFGFSYALSFKDNIDVILSSSMMICRDENGLVTNAVKKEVVRSRAMREVSKVSPSADCRERLLIVGSHIVESYLGRFGKDYDRKLEVLSNRVKSLPFDFKSMDVSYLPHPRAQAGGEIELRHVYSSLKPTVIDYSGGAKNYVLESMPDKVICLAGSTLYMEIPSCQYKGDLIAWGFEELATLGCHQAEKLKNVQVKLKVSIL